VAPNPRLNARSRHDARSRTIVKPGKRRVTEDGHAERRLPTVRIARVETRHQQRYARRLRPEDPEGLLNPHTQRLMSNYITAVNTTKRMSPGSGTFALSSGTATHDPRPRGPPITVPSRIAQVRKPKPMRMTVSAKYETGNSCGDHKPTRADIVIAFLRDKRLLEPGLSVALRNFGYARHARSIPRQQSNIRELDSPRERLSQVGSLALSIVASEGPQSREQVAEALLRAGIEPNPGPKVLTALIAVAALLGVLNVVMPKFSLVVSAPTRNITITYSGASPLPGYAIARNVSRAAMFYCQAHAHNVTKWFKPLADRVGHFYQRPLSVKYLYVWVKVRAHQWVGSYDPPSSAEDREQWKAASRVVNSIPAYSPFYPIGDGRKLAHEFRRLGAVAKHNAVVKVLDDDDSPAIIYGYANFVGTLCCQEQDKTDVLWDLKCGWMLAPWGGCKSLQQQVLNLEYYVNHSSGREQKWFKMLLSSRLIKLLLVRGGVEPNPGPHHITDISDALAAILMAAMDKGIDYLYAEVNNMITSYEYVMTHEECLTCPNATGGADSWMPCHLGRDCPKCRCTLHFEVLNHRLVPPENCYVHPTPGWGKILDPFLSKFPAVDEESFRARLRPFYRVAAVNEAVANMGLGKLVDATDQNTVPPTPPMPTITPRVRAPIPVCDDALTTDTEEGQSVASGRSSHSRVLPITDHSCNRHVEDMDEVRSLASDTGAVAGHADRARRVADYLRNMVVEQITPATHPLDAPTVAMARSLEPIAEEIHASTWQLTNDALAGHLLRPDELRRLERQVSGWCHRKTSVIFNEPACRPEDRLGSLQSLRPIDRRVLLADIVMRSGYRNISRALAAACLFVACYWVFGLSQELLLFGGAFLKWQPLCCCCALAIVSYSLRPRAHLIQYCPALAAETLLELPPGQHSPDIIEARVTSLLRTHVGAYLIPSGIVTNYLLGTSAVVRAIVGTKPDFTIG